jgi:phage baseplate assembly protein V
MNKFVELFKRIFKTEERLKGLLRYGVIKEIDVAANTVVVKFGDNLESPMLPYMVNSSGNASVYFIPKIGDQVVILCPDGDINNSVVLPSVRSGKVSSEDEWRLEFSQGSIIYKAGELEIKANTQVKLDAPKVVLSGEDGGGVVCQNNICAFTGGPHPEGSTKVFGSR